MEGFTVIPVKQGDLIHVEGMSPKVHYVPARAVMPEYVDISDFVPTTRRINGHQLSSDIIINQNDIEGLQDTLNGKLSLEGGTLTGPLILNSGSGESFMRINDTSNGTVNIEAYGDYSNANMIQYSPSSDAPQWIELRNDMFIVNKMWHGGNFPYKNDSWTPEVHSTASPEMEYETRGGAFTRIGTIVFFRFTLVGSVEAGDISIGGLPYQIDPPNALSTAIGTEYIDELTNETLRDISGFYWTDQ